MPLLSIKAKLLIKKLGVFKRGKHFFQVLERLNHDGYDSEGPKSNIWYLFIYDINNKLIKCYYREYRFKGEDLEEYRLYNNCTLIEFRNSMWGELINSFALI